MTDRAKPRLSSYDLPVGFCVRSRTFHQVGEKTPWEVVWATGIRYTRDGNNPDRVEIHWLSRHDSDLYLSYASPGELYAAEPEEIKAWVAEIRVTMNAKKVAASDHAEGQRYTFEQTAKEFERYMKEALK